MSNEEDFSDISVMIVDDSDFSRKILSEFISKAGFNIVGEANSASEAIKIASDRKVDMAIIDVVMPDTSGIELTELLVKSLRKLKVIMVSSLAQENIIINSISAGAVDFLQKPIKEDVLIHSMSKICVEIRED
jgi:two-component system, chemotaxis family, chemotaxis protein CheY